MNKTFSYIAASAITAISIIFLFSEPYIDLYPQKIRNILLGAFYATTLFSFFCLRNEIRLRTTATFGICASILGGISCILAFYTNNTVSADGKTIAALEVTSRASKYLFSACLVLLAHKVKEDKYLKYSALSICSAVSVFKVLKSFGVNNLSIKWPNDVYVSDKKICGILLEGCSADNQITDIIIGIGINVNQTDFSGEYNATPTSMAIELNKKINLSCLKRKIYSQLKKDIKSLNYSNDYLLVARENNYLKGKCVYAEINGKKTPITVIDIADDNSLICEYNGEQRKIFSG